MSMEEMAHLCVWKFWMVGSIVERTDYHTDQKSWQAVREVLERLHQSFMFHGRYKLWLHECLFGSRDFGPATSYVL